MAGYFNRDIHRRGEDDFRAYCGAEHLPVTRPAYWQAITEHSSNPPYSLVDYLRQTFGGADNLREYLRNESPYGDRETVRDHIRRMTALATPDGYAWTCWSVGAPCEVCGVEC